MAPPVSGLGAMAKNSLHAHRLKKMKDVKEKIPSPQELGVAQDIESMAYTRENIQLLVEANARLAREREKERERQRHDAANG